MRVDMLTTLFSGTCFHPMAVANQSEHSLRQLTKPLVVSKVKKDLKYNLKQPPPDDSAQVGLG
jgi:hypothetical protein